MVPLHVRLRARVPASVTRGYAAIGQAIDRKSIAEVAQHGLVADPVPLNNHIFLAGQEGYQDNSPPFDPDAAARELDALGWKLNGAFREKDGQRLVSAMCSMTR